MAMSSGKVFTTFEIENVIQPTYTGGDVSLDAKGQVLASCLGEECILSRIATGKTLARVDGVSVHAIENISER